MPSPLVAVGQAGNQIAAATMRYTGPTIPIRKGEEDGYAKGCSMKITTGKRTGKRASGAVFVDSEPKVVRAFMDTENPAYLPFADDTNVVFDQSGRGNNWAWGYTGISAHRGKYAKDTGGVKGEPLWFRGMKSLRRQAEACDAAGGVDSIIVTHSLGGGTGAGLGSKLLESIHEEYSRTPIISVCIAPFKAGDTPLQHYNTVLTLATAHECASAVVFFDNDDLLNRAKVRRKHASAFGSSAAVNSASASHLRAHLRAERGGKNEENRISTAEINDVLAQSLAGMLLPSYHRGRVGAVVRKPSVRPAKPDWVAPEAPPARREEGVWDSSGPGEERGGWIEASVKGISAAAAEEEAEDALRDGLFTNAFNGSSFIESLCPTQALKYLDVRTVNNAFLEDTPSRQVYASGCYSYACPSLTWPELADNLSDITPRYDAESRQIVTFAAKAFCRGASQVDADSVDPSLPAAAESKPSARSTATGRLPLGSTRSMSQQWYGLPTTEEWLVVGTKLKRVFVPASPGADALFSSVLTPMPPPSLSPIQPFKLQPNLRSLTVAANTDGMVSTLMNTVERVDELMRIGAYLHWYERFGVTRDHMQAAAESVLTAIDAYVEARPVAKAPPAAIDRRR